MALDATVGGVSANSYVTVQEATEYLVTRLHSADTWDAAADQDAALITATSMLDWYLRFKGTKTSTTQRLKWPRTEVYDSEGALVASTIIPFEVKVATFELAVDIISADRTGDSDLAGISSIKIGPLTINSDGTSYNSTTRQAIPEKIRAILSPLTVSGGIRVVRLQRG